LAVKIKPSFESSLGYQTQAVGSASYSIEKYLKGLSVP
jgi:hypothetical protein